MAPIDRTGCPGRLDAKGNPRHGNRQAYKRFGCRCPDGCEAERVYSKRQRHGRHTPQIVPAIGSARRLQALAVAGHSLSVIGRHLNMPPGSVYSLRAPRYATILATQAKQISDLYDWLHLEFAEGPHVKRTRTCATKNGWAPAFAWDEWSIDFPDAVPDYGSEIRPEVQEWETVLDAGELPEGQLVCRLPKAERPDAARRQPKTLRLVAVVFLTHQGWVAPQIAKHLRTTERTVTRDREIARSAGWRSTYEGDVGPVSNHVPIAHLATRHSNQTEAPHSVNLRGTTAA